MFASTHRNYLLKEQYNDGSNLCARIALHERFGTNPNPWHCWVFDQFDLPPKARILELGCGIGRLWSENIGRVPPGWDVTISDISPGMVVETRSNISHANARFHFEVADAASIPHSNESYDAVIANHMLYHVCDRAMALGEIHRVLRPGGRLYSATNGQANLRELSTFVKAFSEALHMADSAAPLGGPGGFTLEDGLSELPAFFEEVTLRRYDDILVITDVAPLVAFVLSTHVGSGLQGEKLSAFIAFVERGLENNGGSICISKDLGMFVAKKH